MQQLRYDVHQAQKQWTIKREKNGSVNRIRMDDFDPESHSYYPGNAPPPWKVQTTCSGSSSTVK